MGLFTFFNNKDKSADSIAPETTDSVASTIPDVPQSLFIDNSGVANQPVESKKTNEENNSNNAEMGIYILYKFFEKNYESKGYDDALRNPDSHHLEQNLIALQYELEREIKQVKTFYQDFLRETQFHIQTRSRSGLVDTVEELEMKKAIADDHYQKVIEIEEDLKNSRGDGQGVLVSYTRGFRNGLAAISHYTIISKKF